MKERARGLELKPGTREDVEAAHELIVAYDIAMSGRVEFGLEDFHSLTQKGEFEFERDLLTVWDQGEMVGVALYWNGDPETAPANSVAITRPGRTGQGVGSTMLDFLEARQRSALERRPDSSPILWAHVDLADDAAHELVRSRGFEEVRRHYTMEISLGGIEEPRTPDGIEMAPIEEQDLPAFHDVLEESFAEHWGNTPVDYEEFLEADYRRPDTRLDLWMAAREGGAVAGIMLGRIREGVGWVDALGVLEPFRKRGIGDALLKKAFVAFQDLGLETASLGVDASNATGAVGLYERAGMAPVRVYVSYEKSYA